MKEKCFYRLQIKNGQKFFDTPLWTFSKDGGVGKHSSPPRKSYYAGKYFNLTFY